MTANAESLSRRDMLRPVIHKNGFSGIQAPFPQHLFKCRCLGFAQSRFMRKIAMLKTG